MSIQSVNDGVGDFLIQKSERYDSTEVWIDADMPVLSESNHAAYEGLEFVPRTAFADISA
jgi:hypothetical protein